MRRNFFATPFVALALTLSACTAGPAAVPGDAQLVVDLKEYSVNLSVASVKAGRVKIAVRNSGTMEHEFELIKTDIAPDKLPQDSVSAKAKEDGLVKQAKGIGIGRLVNVTADLQAGSYVIICNVPGHYQLGMQAGLKVE